MRNLRYFGPAQSYEEALERLARHRGPVAIDTETIALKGEKSTTLTEWGVEYNDETGEQELVETARKVGLDAKTCIGIGVATSETEGYYFPLHRPGWVNVPYCDTYAIMELLRNPSITKVFFNSMFDLDRIEDATGIDVSGNYEDVAIACQVQGLWNSLDQNSSKLLYEDHVVIDDVLPKGKTMLDVPFMVTSEKCIWDCLTTMKLYNLMKMREWSSGPVVWEDGIGRQFDVSRKIIDCYNVDHECVKILRKMTKRGFKVRQDKVREIDIRLRREMQTYDSYFAQWGINPLSNDQVGWLMASRGNSVPLTESGKHLKVNEEVLLQMGKTDPMVHMVLARRRRQKLWGTYVKPFLGLDRAYTHFRLDLATGRLGSSEFNSQNLPPSMRCIFEADSGIWTWADLHQAEMRVWAHQAHDEVMLKEFANGSSPHVATLKYLFPGVAKSNADGSSTVQYVDSKSFNFALLADASAAVLARTTKRPVEVVQGLKDKLYELYWQSKVHQDEMRQRHQPWTRPDWVEDDFGRRCHIPDSSLFVDEMHQEKCRLNYPFQATVASYVKRAMIGLDVIGMDMVCQVHDEILVGQDIHFPDWLANLHPSVSMPFEETRGDTWV